MLAFQKHLLSTKSVKQLSQPYFVGSVFFWHLISAMTFLPALVLWHWAPFFHSQYRPIVELLMQLGVIGLI